MNTKTFEEARQWITDLWVAQEIGKQIGESAINFLNFHEKEDGCVPDDIYSFGDAIFMEWRYSFTDVREYLEICPDNTGELMRTYPGKSPAEHSKIGWPASD